MTHHTRTPPQTLSRDPDLVNAEIALKRAANRAHEQAKKNGTAIVISENGIVKEIDPEPLQEE